MYEETRINGVLHFRTSVFDEWKRCEVHNYREAFLNQNELQNIINNKR